MLTKQIATPAHLKTTGADEGRIEAVFATFNTIDLDGDVTLPTAFTPGQEVLMCWAHDWANPIGKGVIRVEETRAVFDGAFWLDTSSGLEAYRRVKNAGGLQEFSYGYGVTEKDHGTYQGQRVRFLKSLAVHEISPVLKGAAGPGNSSTLRVKARPASACTLRAAAFRAIAKGRVDVVALDRVSAPHTHRRRAAAVIAEARALGLLSR